MGEHLFHLDPASKDGLQLQIRTMLVNAILEGHILPGSPLPSCRELARQLSVSRNTTVLAYERLVDDGFLYSRERSGYFVADHQRPALRDKPPAPDSAEKLDWERRLHLRPAGQRNIVKPANWRSYPYPFIYGQLDHELFPFSEWRECLRDANSRRAIGEWLADSVDGDDAMLLQQLRTKVLPRRGVRAGAEEILVTLGTQHSLYLVSQLLIGPEITVGVEDPGYVDARNIFASAGAHVIPLPVDDQGLIVDHRIAQCDLVFVTPSHQSPTTVTMSLRRRQELLEHARRHDFVILEDDYESETNFLTQPIPALKSLDHHDRVIYMSSLSKTLAPGLRLGYLVATRSFLRQARALRRLMVRHPPSNNQRTVALFLARGHHDAMIHRLTRVYQQRWETMHQALNDHLPAAIREQTFGGTSFWLRGEPRMDCRVLTRKAADRGILVEPGDVHFAARTPPRHYFRLGFAAITEARIRPGLKALGQLMREL